MSKFLVFKGNEVMNKKGQLLGIIRFHSHWKKHVFESYNDTFFDSECLKDIANELWRRDKEWKMNK